MRTIVFVMLFLLLTGCSTDSAWRKRLFPSAQDRAEAEERADAKARQREHAFDGKSEDEIVLDLGAPTKIDTIGNFKVYTYYQDNGTTTTVRDSASPLFGTVTESGNAQTIPHFYQQRFYFQHGKVVKWDEDEQ